MNNRPLKIFIFGLIIFALCVAALPMLSVYFGKKIGWSNLAQEQNWITTQQTKLQEIQEQRRQLAAQDPDSTCVSSKCLSNQYGINITAPPGWEIVPLYFKANSDLKPVATFQKKTFNKEERYVGPSITIEFADNTTEDFSATAFATKYYSKNYSLDVILPSQAMQPIQINGLNGIKVELKALPYFPHTDLPPGGIEYFFVTKDRLVKLSVRYFDDKDKADIENAIYTLDIE